MESVRTRELLLDRFASNGRALAAETDPVALPRLLVSSSLIAMLDAIEETGVPPLRYTDKLRDGQFPTGESTAQDSTIASTIRPDEDSKRG